MKINGQNSIVNLLIRKEIPSYQFAILYWMRKLKRKLSHNNPK